MTTTFTIHQPAHSVILFTLGDLDIYHFLADATALSNLNPTSYTASSANYTIDYTGTGLVFGVNTVTAGKITSFTVKDTETDLVVTVVFSTPVSAKGLQNAAAAYLSSTYSDPSSLDAIFHSQALVWGPEFDDDGFPNMSVHGTSFGDKMFGARGDDTLYGSAGADTIDGGVNDVVGDQVNYAASSKGVTVTLGPGGAQTTGAGGLAKGDKISNIEDVTGGKGNDKLTGNEDSNALIGGEGNDTIEGGAGADFLDGGAGINTLSYASDTSGVTVNIKTGLVSGGDAEGDSVAGLSFTNLIGGSGQDFLRGTSAKNLIVGGANDDWIDGGNSEGGTGDVLKAGEGIDTLFFEQATKGITIDLGILDVQQTGGAGKVKISGFENVVGSVFADVLTGTATVNVIIGGLDNDVIEGKGGADELDGQDGDDLVSYASSAKGVTVNLFIQDGVTAQTSGGDANGDILSGFESVRGSAFDDMLTGDTNENTIEGGAGNDILDGRDDLDTVSYEHASAGVKVDLSLTGAQKTGGAGTDTLSNFEFLLGSKFNDRLTGDSAANSISGDNGNDTIEGGAGADTLNGGAGVNTLSYASSPEGVNVNQLAGTVIGAGTSHALGDFVFLGTFQNFIGSAHDDTLIGGKGNNIIDAGDGNDFISGGGGVDVLKGGNGVDVLDIADATSGATISLAITKAQVTGIGTLTLSGIESIIGTAHDDNLTGNASANNITGFEGNDTIEGGAGADTLTGGNGNNTVSFAGSSAGVTVDLTKVGVAQVSAGDANGDELSNFQNLVGSKLADTLIGDGNANVITGGKGADTVTGGSGGDTFVFRALSEKGDHITDFESGVDKIAVAGDLAGHDPVRFASGSTPAPGAGTGWFLYDTDDGKLYFDADGAGSGAKVLLVTLDGSPALTAGDFVVL